MTKISNHIWLSDTFPLIALAANRPFVCHHLAVGEQSQHVWLGAARHYQLTAAACRQLIPEQRVREPLLSRLLLHPILLVLRATPAAIGVSSIFLFPNQPTSEAFSNCVAAVNYFLPKSNSV